MFAFPRFLGYCQSPIGTNAITSVVAVAVSVVVVVVVLVVE